MIGRSKKDAVPFLCKSLPVQIVSRSCPRLSSWNACAVLVNDHRPHGLDIVRNPEAVYDTNLQIPFGCGRRENNLEFATFSTRWRKMSPHNPVWRYLLDRNPLLMT